MRHKPIDEMSLRHLFATNYATNFLNIEYWGPVINKIGKIESSPDCLVLDKRKTPYTLKRCEFKFKPESIKDFSDNGSFEIAVVWDLALPKSNSRQEFEKQLQQQNGCDELIVLNDMKAFNSLPEYTSEQSTFHPIATLEAQLNKIEHDDIVYSAYLIAKAYPHPINSQKFIELLVEKFPRVRDMSIKGRANVIGRFIQMKPQLVKKLYRSSYVWNNDEFPEKESVRVIAEHIVNNRRFAVPHYDILRKVL